MSDPNPSVVNSCFEATSFVKRIQQFRRIITKFHCNSGLNEYCLRVSIRPPSDGETENACRKYSVGTKALKATAPLRHRN